MNVKERWEIGLEEGSMFRAALGLFAWFLVVTGGASILIGHAEPFVATIVVALLVLPPIWWSDTH